MQIAVAAAMAWRHENCGTGKAEIKGLLVLTGASNIVVEASKPINVLFQMLRSCQTHPVVHIKCFQVPTPLAEFHNLILARETKDGAARHKAGAKR